MGARRALLYVPGCDLHKIQKAITLGVDTICLDIEDGVAINRKTEARTTIAEALRTIDFAKSERLVRINPLGSGLEEEDLQKVLPAHPAGIVIPKVKGTDEVHWFSEQIAAVERREGWPEGEIGLHVLIETARAIVDLAKVAGADRRIKSLIFGAEDFANDIGAVRTPQAWEVFYGRSAIVTYAAAFGLQAIDMVYTDFRDSDGLLAESIQGAQMGFSGKQVIHPAQVGPVQQAFTPSDEAIAYATRIVQTFASHQQAGRGAFELDGKMVDAPVVKLAEGVLERARAAGKV
jgi:citrate lyase subunit beta-like protein